MTNKSFHTVEDYIHSFPEEVAGYLGQMRDAIRQAAPGAAEGMSYGLVGYKYLGKPLVYFGGFRSHAGFYGTPHAHEAFQKEFEKYKQGKGSVQFPLTQKPPLALIKKVIRYNMKQIERSVEAKKKI